MADERRTSPRVRISGVRVVYESGTGEPVDADAFDLAAGGLFVHTATPLAVGKRISLEIQVLGEAVPWAALGRVVWSREKAQGEEGPPGMGVKLIDADEAVLASLARLVDTRERTERGVGEGLTAPATPVVAAAPERERTILGVGTSSRDTPVTPRVADVISEPVVTKAPAPSPLPPRAPGAEPKKGGAGRILALLALLVVAGVAAYALLDAFRMHRH